MGKKRTFTLSEAETILPVLGGLLWRAVGAKRKLQEIENRFEQIRSHVSLCGGADLDIRSLARQRAEADKLIQELKDSVAEIDATGVQVKDLDMGLLDFPCKLDGRTILLCWRIGEEKISHWHEANEGFAGRKRIDERLRGAPRKVQ